MATWNMERSRPSEGITESQEDAGGEGGGERRGKEGGGGRRGRGGMEQTANKLYLKQVMS